MPSPKKQGDRRDYQYLRASALRSESGTRRQAYGGPEKKGKQVTEVPCQAPRTRRVVVGASDKEEYRGCR